MTKTKSRKARKKKTKIVWRKGVPTRGLSAVRVAEELEHILAKKKLKQITGKELLAVAKNKSSYLHKYFQWDDRVAAERYRLKQANELLSALEEIEPVYVIRVHETAKEIAADTEQRVKHISALRVAGSREYVFKPTADILKSKSDREQLLAQAYADLQAFKRKYIVLSELSNLFSAIDKALNGTP